ncbi:MAG: choice-of-anchor I family protein [Anaerolineae bacterium]|nr:choice-of-anchor I family protein [Anaerolineae bacterium]
MRSALATVSLAVLLGMTALAQETSVELQLLSTFQTNVFGEGAAEIAAFDPETNTLFVVNGDSDSIDLLSIADPAAIAQIGAIAIEDGSPNSVAFLNGVLAIAVEGEETMDNGRIIFANAQGEILSEVTVGVLPDMVIFSPNGKLVITANEGEPSDDYSKDPLGSVSIIDISGGVDNLTDAAVTTLTFEAYDAPGALPEGVRVYGPNAKPSQDFEPEYVAVSTDSTAAYVSLQENNALAVIDLVNKQITALIPLGFKDHRMEGMGFDGGNDDGVINIANWPVFGLYQPDAIVYIMVGEMGYILSANEGDTRDYDGYSEEGEVGETPLDPTAYPNADELAQESAIGGLEILTSIGDTDGDGDIDQMYLPGARSFSVWSTSGELIWDSGDAFERITAEVYPDDFNSTNDENGSFDDRSDNKGPEPEDIKVGAIDGKLYAFIGLERIGGVMVYDVTDPTAPRFVGYSNNRDFSGDAEAGTAGDLGPEGVLFISAADSPNGQPLLVVTNEISGSTSVFQVVVK